MFLLIFFCEFSAIIQKFVPGKSCLAPKRGNTGKRVEFENYDTHAQAWYRIMKIVQCTCTQLLTGCSNRTEMGCCKWVCSFITILYYETSNYYIQSFHIVVHCKFCLVHLCIQRLSKRPYFSRSIFSTLCFVISFHLSQWFWRTRIKFSCSLWASDCLDVFTYFNSSVKVLQSTLQEPAAKFTLAPSEVPIKSFPSKILKALLIQLYFWHFFLFSIQHLSNYWGKDFSR